MNEAASVLSKLGPGSVICIEGYVNSKGESRDRELTLLPREGYAEMLKEAEKRLKDWESSKPARRIRPAHMTPEAAAEAVATLLARVSKGDGNTAPARAFYEHVGGSVYTLGAPPVEQFYILRCREQHNRPDDLSKLKDVAAMAELLDLPNLDYVHAVKFTKQSFQSVYVKEIA